MLEKHLANIRTSSTETQQRIDFNQNGLQQAHRTLAWLDPKNLAIGKPIESQTVARLMPKQEQGWEDRMGILRRVTRLRERLTDYSIPNYKQRLGSLGEQMDALQQQEAFALDQIQNQLLTDREFIKNGIEKGHLHPGELAWIDAQFERFGFETPKIVKAIETPLEVLLKNPRTGAAIKEFSKTPGLPFVMDCVEKCLAGGVDLKELRGRVNGHIFEQLAYKAARTMMLTSGSKAPFVLTSPDVTFDIFRTIRPDKAIDIKFHGLQKTLQGVRVTDGIIIWLKGNDEAEFYNIVEYSMVNLNVKKASAQEKQKQVDHLSEYDNSAFQNLAAWAEKYNKKQINTASLFDAYPLLAGRKFRVRTPQEGFSLFYYLAEKQSPPAGVEKDHVREININPSNVANFTDSIIATCQVKS